jgi:hypothetical protein
MSDWLSFGFVNGMDATLTGLPGETVGMSLTRESPMTIKTIVLDLAKQVFQILAIDERGQVVLKKQLARAKLAAFFTNIPPCLVSMEACSRAHFWANNFFQALTS